MPYTVTPFAIIHVVDQLDEIGDGPAYIAKDDGSFEVIKTEWEVSTVNGKPFLDLKLEPSPEEEPEYYTVHEAFPGEPATENACPFCKTGTVIMDGIAEQKVKCDEEGNEAWGDIDFHNTDEYDNIDLTPPMYFCRECEKRVPATALGFEETKTEYVVKSKYGPFIWRVTIH